MANTTFKMNGWIYTYNEPMTSNWGWPEGKKGERTRILKKQMLQLLKERDAFNTPFEEIDEPAEAAQEAPSSPAEADSEPVEEQERARMENATETAETAESTEEPVKVSIPTEMYTGKSLRNLINLVYTRAGLINKALGTRLSVDQGFIETINSIAADDDIKKAIEGNESAMVYSIIFLLLPGLSRDTCCIFCSRFFRRSFCVWFLRFALPSLIPLLVSYIAIVANIIIITVRILLRNYNIFELVFVIKPGCV